MGFMAFKLNQIVGPPFPADDINYYLEIDFPKTWPHCCTVITSFLLIYIDAFGTSDCQLSWERELKSRVELEGLEKAKIFQAEMLEMGLHPNNFLTNLKALLSQLSCRCIPVYCNA